MKSVFRILFLLVSSVHSMAFPRLAAAAGWTYLNPGVTLTALSPSELGLGSSGAVGYQDGNVSSTESWSGGSAVKARELTQAQVYTTLQVVRSYTGNGLRIADWQADAAISQYTVSVALVSNRFVHSSDSSSYIGALNILVNTTKPNNRTVRIFIKSMTLDFSTTKKSGTYSGSFLITLNYT
jgi:hypothetical protein